MTSLLRQIAATCRIAVSGIPSRWSMSLATVAGIALVVFLLLGFLSMVNGFQRSLQGAGSPEVVVVTSRGSASEVTSMLSSGDLRTLENAPGIARMGQVRLISGEVYRVVGAPEQSTGATGALALRGIDEAGWWARANVSLSAGRLFRAGTREIIVGRQAGQKFQNLDLGATVRLGSQNWTVVGLFEAGGSAIESEVWADRLAVAAASAESAGVQSARIRLTSPDAVGALRRYLQAFPAMAVDVTPENEFYASQSRGLIEVINAIGWPLGLLMAIGALIGSLNTMYSSTETRAREIATLRAVGFGRIATFTGIMAEGVLLALLGGMIGVAAGSLILEQISTSTLSANMAQTVFSLNLTGADVGAALVLALAIGLIGAALPALRSARQPILVGLASSK